MNRPKWKSIACAYKYQSMKRLHRAVSAEQELAEVPKPFRVLCRIICRMVRGRLAGVGQYSPHDTTPCAAPRTLSVRERT